jgi:Flp pilus assembly protein TadB
MTLDKHISYYLGFVAATILLVSMLASPPLADPAVALLIGAYAFVIWRVRLRRRKRREWAERHPERLELERRHQSPAAAE